MATITRTQAAERIMPFLAAVARMMTFTVTRMVRKNSAKMVVSTVVVVAVSAKAIAAATWMQDAGSRAAKEGFTRIADLFFVMKLVRVL